MAENKKAVTVDPIKAGVGSDLENLAHLAAQVCIASFLLLYWYML